MQHDSLLSAFRSEKKCFCYILPDWILGVSNAASFMPVLLSDSFLDPEEEECQRTEGESMTQGAYETTAAYGHRFREAADISCPTYQNNPRNDSENRMMWRYYIKGLSNAVTAKKITGQGGAQLFEEAIKQVAKLEAKKQRVSIACQGGWIKDNPDRHEEPMDVNNMETVPSKTSANLEANVRELERKMSGMSSHLTWVTSAVETMAAKLSLDDHPQQSHRLLAQMKDMDAQMRNCHAHHHHITREAMIIIHSLYNSTSPGTAIFLVPNMAPGSHH